MDAQYLALLACPQCHGPLENRTHPQDGPGLACSPCSLFFPIREDIPVLLIEEALHLDKGQGAPLAPAAPGTSGEGK